MPKRRNSAGGNQTGQSSEENITNSSIPEIGIPPQPPRPPGRRPVSIVAGPVSVGVNYGEIRVVGSRIMIDQENLHQDPNHHISNDFCIDHDHGHDHDHVIDCDNDNDHDHDHDHDHDCDDDNDHDHDHDHDCDNDDDIDHYHEHHHHDFNPDLGTF